MGWRKWNCIFLSTSSETISRVYFEPCVAWQLQKLLSWRTALGVSVTFLLRKLKLLNRWKWDSKHVVDPIFVLLIGLIRFDTFCIKCLFCLSLVSYFSFPCVGTSALHKLCSRCPRAAYCSALGTGQVCAEKQELQSSCFPGTAGQESSREGRAVWLQPQQVAWYPDPLEFSEVYLHYLHSCMGTAAHTNIALFR